MENEEIEIKPIVKNILSKELQLYFEKVINTIKTENEASINLVLESIKNDIGIQPLIPYFVQFISEEVIKNLKNLNYLKYLMMFIHTLLENEHLNIEPYLHQLMPPVLTCLVGRKICNDPNENHWEVRDYVANLVKYICDKFGDSYTSLQPRITKTLAQAFLDNSKPLTTQYGAIVGLGSLGFHVIELLILPNIENYMQTLKPKLYLNSNNNNQNNDNIESESIQQMEANKCYQALLKICGIYLHHLSTFLEEQSKIKFNQYYEKLYEIFGESLTIFINSKRDKKECSTLII
jgi:transcription initiation factor TFIID subunit 6